jgi:hypothetical protein
MLVQAMDNTLGDDLAWNTQFDFSPAPTQSLGSYQPVNNGMKRPLQVDTQDFDVRQSKRRQGVDDYASIFASPFNPSASVTGSSWTMETQPTPASSSVDMGLSDEAADVCATWFSKYAVLPK